MREGGGHRRRMKKGRGNRWTRKTKEEESEEGDRERERERRLEKFSEAGKVPSQ